MWCWLVLLYKLDTEDRHGVSETNCNPGVSTRRLWIRHPDATCQPTHVHQSASPPSPWQLSRQQRAVVHSVSDLNFGSTPFLSLKLYFYFYFTSNRRRRSLFFMSVCTYFFTFHVSPTYVRFLKIVLINTLVERWWSLDSKWDPKPRLIRKIHLFFPTSNSGMDLRVGRGKPQV